MLMFWGYLGASRFEADALICTLQEDVIESAKLANANGFITALPNGYDTKACYTSFTGHIDAMHKILVCCYSMPRSMHRL